MDWITNPEIWIGLFTLTVLEIVLGIDNVVFISILAGKLPQGQQAKARQTGLGLALITRVLLLCGLAWMVRLTKSLYHIPAFAVPARGSYELLWRVSSCAVSTSSTLTLPIVQPTMGYG